MLPTADALARAVAERLVARIAAVQAEGRVPSVALTGGTIANEIYRAVAGLPSADVDWALVDFWWGDEPLGYRTGEGVGGRQHLDVSHFEASFTSRRAVAA
ncbi:MAG: pgl [Marmoricola sp.]|nr:pgl [Marmoricola sp.]